MTKTSKKERSEFRGILALGPEQVVVSRALADALLDDSDELEVLKDKIGNVYAFSCSCHDVDVFGSLEEYDEHFRSVHVPQGWR